MTTKDELYGLKSKVNETLEGRHTNLEVLDDRIRFHLTEVGRKDLENTPEEKLHTDQTFLLFIEEWRVNGWVEEIWPWQIGALTSAIILADSEFVYRTEQGDLISVGDVYWNPQYMLRSPCEEMLKDGYVDFKKGERDI